MKKIKFQAISNNGAGTTTFTFEDLIRHKVTFAHPEHWNFRRCTGLKDKNRKEIYEDDIVATGEGFKGKVFLEIDQEHGISEYVIVTEEGYAEALTPPLKIIGNIHDNPSL